MGIRNADYKPPFPYFGGKSAVADRIWSAIGKVDNYVEPFCGSCAVLVLRPGGAQGIETVNDADGLLANFWRALQRDPEAVAIAADNPVNECDLHARHLWLLGQRERITDRLCGDPDFYDAKAAGWWCWGACCWIGSGWCAGNGPWQSIDGKMVLGDGGGGAKRQRPHLSADGQGVNRQRPHLGDDGQGVNRKLPHLGDDGRGVNRKLPHLSADGQGVNRQRPHLSADGQGVNRKLADLSDSDVGECAARTALLIEYLKEIADRIRNVRVCCGDWSRVCGRSVTFRHGMTGVFLDPPYADTAGRDDGIYAVDCLRVAHAAREWAIEQGRNPLMRIVLAGYEGEHKMPRDWRVIEWETGGGYAHIGGSDTAGRANRKRERLWCSPACVREDGMLFDLHSNMAPIRRAAACGANELQEELQ